MGHRIWNCLPIADETTVSRGSIDPDDAKMLHTPPETWRAGIGFRCQMVVMNRGQSASCLTDGCGQVGAPRGNGGTDL